jgi:hypothetical protein
LERASKQYPTLKVLYASGYSGNVLSHRGVPKEGIEIIQKPLSFMGLASRVREILDQEKRGKLQGFLGFGSILRTGFSPNEEPDGPPVDKISLCPDEGLIAANIIHIIEIYMIQESFGNP